MIRFLSKNDLRKIKLVEELSKSNITSLKDLSEKTNISKRILLSLVDSINNDYQGSVHINIEGSVGRISFKKDYCSKRFIKSIFSNYSIFKIIELTFFNNKLTINDISNMVFISTSSIYLLINEFNKYIKDYYDLKLSTNPIQLKGDEVEIRKFYFRIFSELYESGDFARKHLNNDQEEILEEVVEYIIRFLNIETDFYWFNKVKKTSLVSFIRYMTGHKIQDENIINKVRYLMTYYKDKNYDFSFFEEKTGVSLNEEILADIFYPYLLDGFFFRQTDDLSRVLSKNDKTSLSAESAMNLASIVSSLSSKYHLPVKNMFSIILDVHNNSFMEKYGFGSKPLLFDENSKALGNLYKLNPKFFDDLKEKITSYYKNIGEPKDYIVSRLCLALFSDWDGLYDLLVEKKGRLKGVIISDLSKNHAKLIKDQIENLVGRVIELSLYDDFYFTNKKLQNLDCDMIITNFYIPPIEGKIIYQIETSISANNMLDIWNLTLTNQSE